MFNLADLDAILRHPLFLLLATGVVTGYLVPRIAKRWKDHQKGIETRTRFASETTKAVVKFLMAVQLAERNALPQEEYSLAYREWEVRRATLESELRGHFEDGSVARDWASLAEGVTALYRLSGTFSEPYRSSVLEELKVFFSEEATDWEHLRDAKDKMESNERFQEFFGAWWKLREAALLKCGDLGREILAARTTSFG